jgi:hypothetical protein
MSENTLTGRSCEINRRAAKQIYTGRNRCVDAERREMLQPCDTHPLHAQKKVDRCTQIAMEVPVKTSHRSPTKDLSHDNLVTDMQTPDV